MELTQKQMYRIATMIKPSAVLEFINKNRSDYEKWLKEEELKEKETEEYKDVKILKIEREQTTND